jgi:cell division initiation protein
MKLTPLDIHHKEFRNALRGYNPEEVDDFLDEVADEFERLFKENIDLSEKLEAATARVRAYADMERTLQNTMVAAQTSADDIRARAEADAARSVADAESKSQEIVSSALEDKQRSQFELTRLKEAEEEFRVRFLSMLRDYIATVEEPASSALATGSFAIPEPVAAVADAEPEPGPEAEAAFEFELEAEAEEEAPVTGRVSSLILGEATAPVLDDSAVPTLDELDDFALPPRGPMGERDEDVDIEEID